MQQGRGEWRSEEECGVKSGAHLRDRERRTHTHTHTQTDINAHGLVFRHKIPLLHRSTMKNCCDQYKADLQLRNHHHTHFNHFRQIGGSSPSYPFLLSSKTHRADQTKTLLITRYRLSKQCGRRQYAKGNTDRRFINAGINPPDLSPQRCRARSVLEHLLYFLKALPAANNHFKLVGSQLAKRHRKAVREEVQFWPMCVSVLMSSHYMHTCLNTGLVH